MSARCPHLGLEGNRTQVYLFSNSRHRCYVTGAPQRIAGAHQAAVCLTSAYRRCPRLLAVRRQPPSGGGQGLAGSPAGQSGAPPSKGAPQPTDAAVNRSRYADLKKAPPAGKKGRGQRRLTLTEGLVLGLAACIVCAVFFVGYAIYHRMRVGPGMAAPAAAEAPTPTALPTGTLAPTFTPTLPPTQPPAPEATSAPVPTPLPEPTLPSEAAGRRPPATLPPTRLVLPSINLDIPVRPVGVKTVGRGDAARTVWADLPDAGGFHNTSAYPGNPGNTVINGHRDIYAAVFRHLDRVAEGDEIILYVEEVVYPYQVTEVLIVPETFATAAQRAESQRLIGYLPEERLTLVTCTPVGLATHRLLVIARPLEQVPPQEPPAGADTGQ